MLKVFSIKLLGDAGVATMVSAGGNVLIIEDEDCFLISISPNGALLILPSWLPIAPNGSFEMLLPPSRLGSSDSGLK